MSAPSHNPIHAEMAGRLGNGVKRVESQIERVKSRALRPLDLTLPQYVTLMMLKLEPEQTAAQLSRTVLVSTQTMATILKNLERKGLIERSHTDLHARVLLNTLTKKGDELVRKADQVVAKIEQDLKEAFSPSEFEQFTAYLERAQEHLANIEHR